MQNLFLNKSSVLGTINKEGKPWSSEAPFVIFNNKAYIYISPVADHYQNLVDNPNLTFMLVEDEATSNHIFVRQKVAFPATAKELEQISTPIWHAFEQKHQCDMLNIIKNLGFKMFEITLTTGRYVDENAVAFDVELVNDEWNIQCVIAKNIKTTE
ncbi:MAG: hypothetical protein ATN36_00015 [Epulopiscium sp. Nele67-Bin005]|nr:MAG: hypothetical protein ATN36_00015 [Epulopiscium sp. Nele67-Bin005]